jgi:hypothetical protein
MFQFFLNLWKLHRVTEAQIDSAVAMKRITPEQAADIKAIPR